MAKSRKTIWAYVDGEKLVDVVQAALDNEMTVADMKNAIRLANPDSETIFVVEPEV